MTNEEFFNIVKDKILHLRDRENIHDYMIPRTFVHGNSLQGENWLDREYCGPITLPIDDYWDEWDYNLFQIMNSKLGQLLFRREKCY